MYPNMVSIIRGRLRSQPFGLSPTFVQLPNSRAIIVGEGFFALLNPDIDLRYNQGQMII